jgi:uncharacterized membrane protein
MPYDWTHTAPDDSGAVLHRLRLWPHRSLPVRGFVWFITVTACMMFLPALAVLGTLALWGLMPFMLLTIWGVWIALRRSYRSGESFEELILRRDQLVLTRHDPGRADRIWQTNPHWVRAALRKGPVESYLTLTDGRREIELGAFLAPEERRSLYDELETQLRKATAPRL